MDIQRVAYNGTDAFLNKRPIVLGKPIPVKLIWDGDLNSPGGDGMQGRWPKPGFEDLGTYFFLYLLETLIPKVTHATYAPMIQQDQP